MVMDKESEISWLRNAEMEKDLRIQAQQRDFQDQLISKQAAREQVSGTLELLRQELEAIKSNQNTQNPMDISSTTDTANELNLTKQKPTEEKGLFEEKLAKVKSDYDQSLKDKSTELNHLKKDMDDQMRKECKATAKANEHQLQTIMFELRSLKEKHEKETTDRTVGEKALLDNIKASIDPILKTEFKAGEHVGVGTRIKGLQEEITNYCPPTVNKKRGAAIVTDDTFGDLTFGTDHNTCHVHLASTPVKPHVSNININVTSPRVHKEV